LKIGKAFFHFAYYSGTVEASEKLVLTEIIIGHAGKLNVMQPDP